MDARRVEFPLAGGALAGHELGAERGNGGFVLAVHGISASSMAWPAVAEALPPDWTLVAVDLRGRGHSRDLPGPTSLLQHTADVCTVADQLGAAQRPLVLTGHSMGAYVGVLAAAARPELFSRLVLVDGGIPLPLPEDAEPEEVLAQTLGPALERLRVVYDDEDAYVAFFREHPALAEHWNDAVERYVRYDAMPCPAGVRARASEEAVRADGGDLLVSAHQIDAALRSLSVPVHLLTAPYGMLGDPPGLLPAEAVRGYESDLPGLSVEEVPGVNHYTILFQDSGARRVAAALTQ